MSITHYDPDPLVAMTCGGGALHSYGGWLYFGTMQPPYIGAYAHFQLYGQPASDEEAAEVVRNTSRGTVLFRMRRFETRGLRRDRPDRPLCEIELLYGHETMKIYDRQSASWVDRSNLLGQTPLMGGSGFGNVLNIGIRTLVADDDGLFAGTANISNLMGNPCDAYPDGGWELWQLTDGPAPDK